jgi:hypothetical protein
MHAAVWEGSSTRSNNQETNKMAKRIKIQGPRNFEVCPACNVMALAATFNPKSGLCKVCDAKRLASVTYITRETVAPELNELVPDFGYDQDTSIDNETGDITELDSDGERIVVDQAMSSEEAKAAAAKSRALEMQADALLARIDARIQANLAAFAEWAEWYCRLKETTDPLQFLANKVREANYVELRDIKDGFAAATPGQVAALVRIGWDADDVRAMKLTIAEASRLLQRGPRWNWI